MDRTPRRNGHASESGPFPASWAVGNGAPHAARDEAPTERSRRSMRRIPPRLWMPASVLLFLIGPGLAYAGYRKAAAEDRGRVLSEFSDSVSERAHEFEGEVLSFVEVLHSLRGLYDSSHAVERAEFEVYTRDARDRHPAIRAITWAPRVGRAEREAYEERARAEGNDGFRIRVSGDDGVLEPAPQGDEYFPIAFVEPHAGNGQAVGYDLGSDELRERAILEAVDTGTAVMTEPLRAGSRTDSHRGAMLVIAVYDHRFGPAGPDQPLLGILAVAFRFQDFVQAVARQARDAAVPRMSLELIDASVDGKPQVVFPPDRVGLPETPDGPASDERISAAGQTWILRGRPSATFLEEHRDAATPWWVAGAVFVLWELFAGLLMVLTRQWGSEALRRQGRAMELLLRNVAEGVVVTDRRGRIAFANDAARRMAGEQFHLSDGSTPCPEERHPLARALRGETIESEEMRVGDASASGAWVRVTARPLRDEGDSLRGGLMVLHDVTDHRRSQQLLERLSSAVEQTADAVCITDREGAVIYVNPAFESCTGYPREEVLGRRPRFLEGERPDGSREPGLWEGVLAGKVYRGTLVNRRKNGDPYYAEHTITPMKDASGRVTASVIVSKDTTERRRLEEKEVEMRLAARVQQRLFPDAAPAVPGFDLAGAVLPAGETCGDYYDYLRTPDGRLGIAVGDVSGHGLGPALVMAETRAYLRTLVDAGVDPAEAIRRVNLRLCRDLGEGQFVTLLYLVVDPATRRVTYANAGHTAGLLVGPDGEVKARLGPSGPALGFDVGAAYALREGPPVDPGDVLVLMTDGATECPSPDDDLFEEEGVVAAVQARRTSSASAIVEGLRGALREFAAGRPFRDDVTLVVLKAAAAKSALPRTDRTPSLSASHH